MLKIAVCDDDEKVLNQIEDLIEDAVRGTMEKMEISQYTSGEQFCERAEMDMLDIIYMDIEMEIMNGIKTAEHLRKSNTHAKIIYVTSYDNYLRQLFGVNTFGFIDKPINEVKFKRIFHAACKEIRSYNDVLSYTFGKTIHRILLRDIMYFRSNAHVVNIHRVDGEEVNYYDKLSEVVEKLAAVDFLQISKSYLVNLLHVDSLNLSEVTMKNNEVLPISRAFREQVFKAYCRYMERRNHR